MRGRSRSDPLPAWRRALLEQALLPGVTTADIAQRLGCSRDVVNREIRLALKSLRASRSTGQRPEGI